MTDEQLYKLKFPVGKFSVPENYTPELLITWISKIQNLPQRLKQELEGLTAQQLSASYRPEGWNIAQIVHHYADSHLNAYIRFKLALTEDTPTVKPYAEALWAGLNDGKDLNISASLQIIEGVHARWTILLKTLSDTDFKKGFFHPEHKRIITLNESLGMYAWHCDDHIAHIQLAKQNPY